MSYQNGPPKIVTDGLVLMLDPIISKSYPGSGNTLYDLSGRGNNGTINGATYWSDGKGSFNFDGVNDYISTTPGEVFYQYNTELTTCAWFKRNGTITGGSGGGQSTADSDNWSLSNVWLFHGNPNNTISFYVNAVNNGSYYYRAIDSPILDDRTWYFICGSCNSTNLKLYINGILYATTTGITTGNIVNNSNSVVQYGKDPRYATNRFFNGQISANYLYNRELTASEILHNYNATKYRFGL